MSMQWLKLTRVAVTNASRKNPDMEVKFTIIYAKAKYFRKGPKNYMVAHFFEISLYKQNKDKLSINRASDRQRKIWI